MKKALIHKTIFDVIPEDEYIRRSVVSSEINKELISETAIEKDGYIYPVISINNNTKEFPNVIGVVDCGPCLVYNKPQTEEEQEVYDVKGAIDFDNTKDLKDMIQKTAELEKAEKSILIDKNNIYNIVINEDDTPEFALLKQAINNKQIDISSYKNRLSDSFSNNIRLLTNGNSITFSKLRTFAQVFDLECELIIRDKPHVVNPMGEELRTIVSQ